MTTPLGPAPGRFCLGIDTGGTFTDAVVYAFDADGAADRVVAAAKTPTRHDDLYSCVVEAMTRVLAGGDGSADPADPADDGPSAADIGLVAVSTTLATNALVEGAGRPAGLVAIGFEPEQLGRVGLGVGSARRGGMRADSPSGERGSGPEQERLGGNLGSAPVVLVDGGHTAQGDMRAPLDLDELHRATERIDGSVDAYAVAAQFSVRNNSHELAARDAIRRLTGKPVTCSHELSPRLGGPRRAVTTLLNAQLISVTARFAEAIRAAMASLGLSAPLMVARGDGSLVGADFVTLRPIETVLSGPAASVIGARHLAMSAPEGGLDIDAACLIADIGGTTTDIAAIRDGVAAAGFSGEDDTAVVAGHATMVTALPTTTVGLGGDSEIWIPADGASGELAIGPRRVIPLCVAARRHPDVVLGMLQQQLSADTPLTEFGQVLLDARPGGTDDGAGGSEGADGIDGEVLRLVRAAGGALQLADLKRSARWRGALGRLERGGALRRAALTPTDACVVLGLVDAEAVGDAEAARLGSELFSRQRDRYGVDIGTGAVELSRRVLQVVLRDAAEALLGVALSSDGIVPTEIRRPLTQAALDRRQRTLGRPAAALSPGAASGGAATDGTASDGTASDDLPPDDAARSGASPLWGLLDGGTSAGVPVAGDVVPEQSDPAPLARIDAGAAVPIVVIGAPAVTYAPLIADLLGTVSVVPPHAEVANAVGAAVARIRITKHVTVTAPRRGSYRAHWGEDPPIWHSLSEAREWATAQAVEAARAEATEAGALDPEITVDFLTRTAPSNGRELFVEATLRVTAAGRPSLT
ncbi:hydantoinase/oxoprolinase N-terminal domain-containing protein [Candidatus Poriferisodalis sp.]|uniref:hydantoinase/oxoprolinase N-terminal domain-containing protein n=1 Tax=Candidatus Poriferisodalis sp. TaxID=3101277 RepID=UPI003B01D38D